METVADSRQSMLESARVMKPTDPRDRRAFIRMQGRKGAFVNLEEECVKPWQILDISPGGLAFRYLVGCSVAMKPWGEMDLLASDGAFTMEKVPFRTVSKSSLPDEVFRGHTVKRCGIQFGELTREQKSEICHFIEHYAE